LRLAGGPDRGIERFVAPSFTIYLGPPLSFEVLGAILEQETIAVGRAIRELARLRKTYGTARWRKRKGVARIRLDDGTLCTAEIHGMKRTASVRKSSRSNASSPDAGVRKHHVICVANRGYEVSLERCKIYLAVTDGNADAERAGFVRVIDESGEDYLYPKRLFADIRLTPRVAKALGAGA
jgi:hypothetical protein